MKKGFVEILIILIIVFAVGIRIFIVYKGFEIADSEINKDNYLLSAQFIADTLGDETREGYGDGVWDDYDKTELLKALKVPVNTPFEEVPPTRIMEFVKEKEVEAGERISLKGVYEKVKEKIEEEEVKKDVEKEAQEKVEEGQEEKE